MSVCLSIPAGLEASPLFDTVYCQLDHDSCLTFDVRPEILELVFGLMAAVMQRGCFSHPTVEPFLNPGYNRGSLVGARVFRLKR